MEFKNILAETRKQQGMSQEALAERIGVSRQAVSKWETGEASPDLPKLLALADALKVSLDVLCGRGSTSDAPQETSTEKSTEQSKPARLRHFLIALCIALVLVPLLVILLNIAAFTRSGPNTEETEVTAEENTVLLPDTLAVSGVRFDFTAGKVTCSFVPSAIDDSIEYELIFSPGTPDFPTVVVPAMREGAVYHGTAEVLRGVEYTVAASAQAGNESRAIVLAMSFVRGDSGATWS